MLRGCEKETFAGFQEWILWEFSIHVTFSKFQRFVPIQDENEFPSVRFPHRRQIPFSDQLPASPPFSAVSSHGTNMSLDPVMPRWWTGPFHEKKPQFFFNETGTKSLRVKLVVCWLSRLYIFFLFFFPFLHLPSALHSLSLWGMHTLFPSFSF